MKKASPKAKATPTGVVSNNTPVEPDPLPAAPEPTPHPKPRTSIAVAAGVPKPAPGQFIDDDDEDYLDEADLKANEAYFDNGRDDKPQPNPCRWTTDGFDPPSSLARPLSLEVTRMAVRHWREAKALSARAEKKLAAFRKSNPPGACEDDANDFEVWACAAQTSMMDAEAWLAACVALVHGLIDSPSKANDMPKDWNPVAFDLDGCIYVIEQTDPGRLNSDPRLIVVGRGGFDDAQYGAPTW